MFELWIDQLILIEMDLETTDYGKRGETKGAKGARRSGRDGGGCGGRWADGERGRNDASTTCETALKEREGKAEKEHSG